MTAGNPTISEIAGGHRPPLQLKPRLVPQRKYVNRVIALWIDSGLGKEICGDRPQAGHDRDILPSIDAIGDRAVLNRSSKGRFPEDPSRIGIERAKLLIQISPKPQVPFS